MLGKQDCFFADGCMECGHCVAVCPKNAVSMDGYDMSESTEYNPETFSLDSEQFLNAVRFRRHAPAVIFVISENPVNASLASANMETMAESMGLGVLYVGLFVRTSKISRNIQKKLGMKGKEKLVTAMAVGYSAVKYARTVPRRPAQVEWK